MLSGLRLVNFRNYDDCRVEFVPGVNLLIGRNGQGKTNVLEALYYLSVLRSFRTGQIEHLRQFGRDYFLLNCRLSDSDGRNTELQISQGSERRLQINGVDNIKSTEFITRLNCVAFLPSDLDIVKGSPSLRRRFLDILLCRLSRDYLQNLQKFNAILKCRNIMLKDSRKYPRSTVQAYDYQMISCAVAIEKMRLEVVSSLNELLKTVSLSFFPSPDNRIVSLRYYPGIDRMRREYNDKSEPMETVYRDSLDSSYDSDCQNGSTRLGPHRGEMVFLLADRSLTNFGSQGECRSAMLALRFAEVKIIGNTCGTDNVTVLVDDVLGELDEIRSAAFLANLQNCRQVIMAATAVPEGIQPSPGGYHLVDGGKITLI